MLSSNQVPRNRTTSESTDELGRLPLEPESETELGALASRVGQDRNVFRRLYSETRAPTAPPSYQPTSSTTSTSRNPTVHTGDATVRAVPPHMSQPANVVNVPVERDNILRDERTRQLEEFRRQNEENALISKSIQAATSTITEVKKLSADGSNYAAWTRNLKELARDHLGDSQFFFSENANQFAERVARAITCSSKMIYYFTTTQVNRYAGYFKSACIDQAYGFNLT